MLKKLFNSVQDRFQNMTSDHPLGSSAGIAQTLSGIAAGALEVVTNDVRVDCV
jgi:hypothetical protein